jgi:SNF2 family DNA or RNA helicase
MNYKFKTKPYAHQLKALEMSWERPYFAYFMEMGTGKSKVLIDNISMLYDNGKINGVLIVAPKGVVKNWHENEIPTHMATHVEPVNVLWRSLINKKQQIYLDQLFKTGEDLHILVMNVEALSTKKGVAFAERFLNSHRTLMAIDESTTIKNPEAKRTKNIVTLGKLATYRRILTGSPVTKSPLDLYKQCEFLEDELLGYRNLDELSEKLKAFSYRVLKDECLDLPKKTFMKREVLLTPDQTKAYLQMQKLAHAQLDGKMMTTATVLTQLMRLQQITCGHFTADDGTIQEMPNNRIGELLDLLDEVEGKVVIWAQFQRDVHNIINALSKEYGEGTFVDYYGLTPQEERQSNIQKFQDPDSGVRFFVGTTQTGGYGITLTAASTMIYYSNGYDLEKRQQSEARIDRIGQEKPMTYIDIICENTVDTRIVKALRKKVDIATQIMGEELKAWI